MNILLTCAGRRNHLVHCFKDALGKRGLVIACDSSAAAPALRDADRRFIVPPMDRAEYFDTLLEHCRQQQIRLIVSVNDLELGGLAQHAPRFRDAGTIPVVAAPKVIATCQDKWEAFQFLRACDVPTPKTYLRLFDVRQALARKTIEYPLIIKPRWGTSSIGVEIVDNYEELDLALSWGKIQLKRTILANCSQADPEHCFVIQERLFGDEFGADIVNDLAGRYAATLGRRKLVMRAGITDRAVTVNDPRLDRIGQVIGERLAHLGSLDCDLMLTKSGFMVLDLNPRLGGGYPFSHLAGANLPAALIAWANREEPDPRWLTCRPGVMSARYDGVMTVEGE